ncbi:substrate-binding domain-containing protein [Trinickia dinghuensis]|uniref:substrate-binding domain-containing protein n=1 Tax=Trinickia dinghuensis TaxID=2291023 RepID=UPI003CCC8DA4
MIDSVGDRTKIAGMLRLGAIESVVHTWLPQLLKRIRDEYRNLTLELTSDTSANLSQQVANGHLDAALLSTPVNGADVGNSLLGSLPMIWIASPALNLSAEALSESELAAFRSSVSRGTRNRTPISRSCSPQRASMACRSTVSRPRRRSAGSWSTASASRWCRPRS